MTAKLKNTMVSRDELTAEVIERKLAEQNLQKPHHLSGRTFSCHPYIVMEVDNNKIYSWANQAGALNLWRRRHAVKKLLFTSKGSRTLIMR